VKKPGVDLASFRMSFMGRSAPGAAGGVAEAAGGVALAGADAGAAGEGGGVCDCEGLQASKLKHATDMKESLKQGDFNA
jgi:hypothetical protein